MLIFFTVRTIQIPGNKRKRKKIKKSQTRRATIAAFKHWDFLKSLQFIW